MVETLDYEAYEAAVDDDTAFVHVETVANPSLVTPDFDALADVAHDHAVPLVVDNTFATPELCRPIEHGADVVWESTTKWLHGAGTTLGGVVSYASGAIGVFHTSLDVLSTGRATVIGTEGRIDVHWPFWHPTSFTVHHHDGRSEHVEIANQGLAHEAAHAMERIRGGHRESDVITLATTVSTMELLDEIRAQLGVVYPQEAGSAGSAG